MPSTRRHFTETVPLPPGQMRLKQVILYVSSSCAEATRFGAIILAKIIWKADFDFLVERGVPVTGRAYRRQKFGPVPFEMPPVLREMTRDGLIMTDEVYLGDGIIERRTIPLQEADLSFFSSDDLRYVNDSIRHYWNMTGTESSDEFARSCLENKAEWRCHAV